MRAFKHYFLLEGALLETPFVKYCTTLNKSIQQKVC